MEGETQACVLGKQGWGGAGLVSPSPLRPPAISSEFSVVWIMMKMMSMAVMKLVRMGLLVVLAMTLEVLGMAAWVMFLVMVVMTKVL